MQRGQFISPLNCHWALCFLLQKLLSIQAHSGGEAIAAMISYQYAQVPRPLNTENNPNTL